MADDSGGGTSALKERLSAEMREAMKARQKVRLSALRLLAAAVKNREVELRHQLSDDEFMVVATHEVKRRKEAVAAYDSAGRPDRASVERQEQEILEAYLPAGLSEEEVVALIEEAVAASGASTPGDMGAVMGYVMARARGRVDGKSVQQQVRDRLGA